MAIRNSPLSKLRERAVRRRAGEQDPYRRESGHRARSCPRLPDSSAEDAREAIALAEKAQRPWEKLAPIERAGYLRRIAAQAIRKDAEHLARVLSEEQRQAPRPGQRRGPTAPPRLL